MNYPFIWENYIDLSEEYKAFRSLDKRASLKRAIEENEIEQIGILHSALDDAINAAQVMKQMISSGWVFNVNQGAVNEKKVASLDHKNVNNNFGK